MNKQYRASGDNKYLTVSLKIDKDIIKKLEKAVSKEPDNNLSRYIEETVKGSPVKEMPVRRLYKTFPIKKTFTFTEDFVKEIKPSGNMSLHIESILSAKLV